MTPPRPVTLDARLEAAAGFIRAPRHADIGSDHAALPIALLQRGRVECGVIVEKTLGPFERAQRHVAGARLAERLEVRLGDGFAPLAPGEVDSASLTGMGARTVQGILERAGERLPSQLVLQANDAPQVLRAWALQRGYHLLDEALVAGFWTYTVLHLRAAAGEDPAYAHVERDVALRWGPWLLRRRDPLLREQLTWHEARLRRVARFGKPDVLRELELIERAARTLG